MCTVLLPPGDNPIAVNKCVCMYIYIYIYIYIADVLLLLHCIPIFLKDLTIAYI